MILYEMGKSRSIKGHWILREAGIEYESRRVDLQGGEGRSEEYRMINPLGKVPALQHGDHVIFESMAIVNYVSSLVPEKNLIPSEVKERALYDQWMSVCLHEYEAPLWLLERCGWYFPKEWNTVDVDKLTSVDARKVLKVLEPRFGEQEFMMDDFTGLDVMWGYVLNWSSRHGWLEEFPNCQDYVRRLKQREACPLS